MRSIGFSRPDWIRIRIPISFCVRWNSFSICIFKSALFYNNHNSSPLLLFFNHFLLFFFFLSFNQFLFFFLSSSLNIENLISFLQLIYNSDSKSVTRFNTSCFSETEADWSPSFAFHTKGVSKSSSPNRLPLVVCLLISIQQMDRNHYPNLDCFFNSFHCSLVKCSSWTDYVLQASKQMNWLRRTTSTVMMVMSWWWTRTRTRSRTMMTTHSEKTIVGNNGLLLWVEFIYRSSYLFSKCYAIDMLLLLLSWRMTFNFEEHILLFDYYNISLIVLL